MNTDCPDALIADTEARSSPQAVQVGHHRERLSAVEGTRGDGLLLPEAIADLIGSIDALPADLRTRKKEHLKATGYGH
jgi:hypothetical protein